MACNCGDTRLGIVVPCPVHWYKPDRPKLVVCGFGRCGSSLLMQMCFHAGLRVAGNWPEFEPVKMASLMFDGAKPIPADPMDEWVERVDALKLLEPADNPIRPGRYRVIWLDRNMEEQAKSWGKLRRNKMNKHSNRKAVGVMKKHMMRNRDRQVKAAERIGECPPLMMRFEDIITNPLAAACALRDFSERPHLDVERMASGVLKRKPQCHEQFLEARLTNMRLA
jgi:hypothetical protein